MDANKWASLPCDLVVEILRRHDTITSIVASAGACKPWRRTIITNVSYLKLLRPDRFNPNLLLGFFYRQWHDGRHLARLQHVPGPFEDVLAADVAGDTMAAAAAGIDAKLYGEPLSCRDGFLLLGGGSGDGLCLCNPLAGTCSFLPSPPAFGGRSSRPSRFVLVTDHDNPRLTGDDIQILAVKEGNNDYYDSRSGVTYQTFFSKSGEWGPVRCSVVDDHRVRVCLGDGAKDVVVCRGSVVYWLLTLVANYGDTITGRGNRCVLAVDVRAERAWTVELPEAIMELGFSVSYSMLAMATSEDGKLSLILQLPGHPMEVWELGGRGKWTLRRKINVQEVVPSNCLNVVGHVHISGFCPRSGCLFGDVDGQDIFIDVERGAVRQTGRYGVGRVTKYPYEMDWPTYISKMKYF